MPTYCALTVRQLKPGTYDEWRKAWWSDDDTMPEGGEAYIARNLQNPDEVVAFGLIDGDLDTIKASMDEDKEKARQEAMAPFIESVRSRRDLRSRRADRRQDRRGGLAGEKLEEALRIPGRLRLLFMLEVAVDLDAVGEQRADAICPLA